MTDYTDSTPYDPTVLHSVADSAQAIRTKMYGKDTREAMAQMGEKLVAEMTDTGYNGAETRDARGSFNTLGARENNQDTQIATKSDKSYVDTMLSSIAQGGPKGIFYSLSALQTAYPSGTAGTYLVFDSSSTDGAHSYIWDSSVSTWKDLGVYQANEDSTTVKQTAALVYDMTSYAYGWTQHLPQGANVLDVSKMKSGYWNANGVNSSDTWLHSTLFYLENSKITVYSTNSTYISFFDANKKFISSVSLTAGSSSTSAFNTLAAPSGAVFFAASALITQANTLTICFGVTGTTDMILASLAIKRSLYMPSQTVVVDQSPGRGDFTSISAAINSVSNGATILVMPGTYYETLKMRSRNIRLIGLSKESTIVISTSDKRENPPLEATGGYFKGITFYAQRPTGATDPTYATPYGAHIDFDNEANQSLVFENCTFKSDWNAGVGIGMRTGFKLAFKKCDIISTYADQGALFFHDSTNSDLAGYYQLKVDDCDITATGKYAIVAMGIDLSGNNLDLVVTRNSLWSDVNGKGDTAIGIQQPDSSKYSISTGSGFGGTATIKLNSRSFGNSADLLNA